MAYKFSRDEKLFFERIIPKMVAKRIYYDYSGVFMFLEMEYQNAFDLPENYPDDYQEMSESIVDAWLTNDPTYLTRIMLVDNKKNLKHLFSNDEDNKSKLDDLFIEHMSDKLAESGLFLKLMIGDASIRTFENIYLNFIKNDAEILEGFNQLVLDLEF